MCYACMCKIAKLTHTHMLHVIPYKKQRDNVMHGYMQV